VVAIVAVLGVATLAVLVAWGLRVIHDIEDLENLSARVVGPPEDIRPAWTSSAEASLSANSGRNVRVHTIEPRFSRAAS
jgi:hypothetical protein